MKIAIIGAGNLGISIARGLISSNEFESLALTRRKIELLKEFEAVPRVLVSTENSDVVSSSEVIILAVQPTQLEDILQEIKPVLSSSQLIISTVTGVPVSKIEEIVGKDQPVIRAMPNTAIAVGNSMTCICGNVSGIQKENIARSIFEKLGTCIRISENKMQAATVICASGVAFWMRLIRATTQGAIQLGFDAREAQELAMHTCHGAASLLIESGKHPEEEIDKVTTPRGCTIEGLNEMEHNGLSSSVIKGLKASFDKINTISQK